MVRERPRQINPNPSTKSHHIKNKHAEKGYTQRENSNYLRDRVIWVTADPRKTQLGENPDLSHCTPVPGAPASRICFSQSNTRRCPISRVSSASSFNLRHAGQMASDFPDLKKLRTLLEQAFPSVHFGLLGVRSV